MTEGLLASCDDDQCRTSVRLSQEKTLNQIEQIDTNQICQHVGYCVTSNSFEPSPIQLRLRNLLRHQTLTLNERLGAHDICSQYGTLSTVCVHIISSAESHRYAYVYKALLKGDTKFIDDDLREQLRTKLDSALCDSCKNAVQSGKDFWINSLVNITFSFLHHSSEHIISLHRMWFIMFYYKPVNDVQRKMNVKLTTMDDLNE